MSESLSANTKAILLLTAPLIVGAGSSRGTTLRPLSLKREYSELVRRLREIGREPADLIGDKARFVLDECSALVGQGIDWHRIESLLGRGVQLSLAVERWRTRAIWVVSRADHCYPRRLKVRLREKAPPILYGCGDRSLLNSGGLAVVGPRDANADLIDYAHAVGALAAKSHQLVISGAARGVDRAAMAGALTAGGWAVGVLANDLARTSTHRENRDALLDGRLVLVSPYDPAARFVAGHAMERNHSVYSLADASLVVEALVDRGGTWAGATAQLDRRSACPVYVRSTLGHSEGLAALEARGALPWPNPQSPEEFGAALDQGVVETPVSGEQRPLVAATAPSTLAEPRRLAAAWQSSDSGEGLGGGKDRNLADELWRAVRIAAWRACREATQLKAAASQFGSTEPQAKEWCARLVAEGVLRLEQRPVRYVATEVLRGKDLGDVHYQSASVTPSDEFWRVIRDFLVRALGEPRSSEEVAAELRLMPRQAQVWLKRLVEEGALERSERPVRYVARPAGLLDGVGPLADRN